MHSRVALDIAAEPGAAGSILFYNDQRNFGTLTVCTERATLEAKLDSLGPPWLGGVEGGGLSLEDFAQVVRRQCANRRGAGVPVAKFLMDQGKTAGIGNYLLSETLYKARVWPWAACGDLDDAEWAEVHAAAAETIHASYEAQAALAAAEQEGVAATRGTFAAMQPRFQLLVYRREVADGLAVRRNEGPHGRAVFWVPQRQTRGRPREDKEPQRL